jgi:hypothetical protein
MLSAKRFLSILVLCLVMHVPVVDAYASHAWYNPGSWLAMGKACVSRIISPLSCVLHPIACIKAQPKKAAIIASVGASLAAACWYAYKKFDWKKWVRYMAVKKPAATQDIEMQQGVSTVSARALQQVCERQAEQERPGASRDMQPVPQAVEMQHDVQVAAVAPMADGADAGEVAAGPGVANVLAPAGEPQQETPTVRQDNNQEDGQEFVSDDDDIPELEDVDLLREMATDRAIARETRSEGAKDEQRDSEIDAEDAGYEGAEDEQSDGEIDAEDAELPIVPTAAAVEDAEQVPLAADGRGDASVHDQAGSPSHEPGDQVKAPIPVAAAAQAAQSLEQIADSRMMSACRAAFKGGKAAKNEFHIVAEQLAMAPSGRIFRTVNDICNYLGMPQPAEPGEFGSPGFLTTIHTALVDNMREVNRQIGDAALKNSKGEEKAAADERLLALRRIALIVHDERAWEQFLVQSSCARRSHSAEGRLQQNTMHAPAAAVDVARAASGVL